MKAFKIEIVGSVAPYEYDCHGASWLTEEEAKPYLPTGLAYSDRYYARGGQSPKPTFKVVEITDWREREQSHLDSSRYKEPIWHNDSRMDPIDGHYAHVSLSDPTLIAFTENETKGQQDRQTSMKPGRYLKRFYPALSAKEIIFYQEWFLSGNKPKMELDDIIELHFAKTPDEIIQVYADGPQSCMKEADSVGVYGAGDLAIAYTTVDGEIKTRAICWPDKGVFGRIYPNVDNWDEDGFDSQSECEAFRDDLLNRFIALGWKSLQTDLTLFNGARILWQKGSPGYARMPYLDWVYRVEFDSKAKCFRVKHEGPISCTETCGEIYAQIERCGFCQKIEMGGGMSQFRSSYNGADEGRCCSSCLDKRKIFYCSGSGRNFAASRLKQVEVDGSVYSLKWAKANFETCAVTGEKAFRTHMYRTGDGKWFQRRFLRDTTMVFSCGYDGQYYLKSDESLIFKGFPKCMDDNRSILDEHRRHYNPDYEAQRERERVLAVEAMRKLQSGVSTFGEAVRTANVSLRDYADTMDHINWGVVPARGR